MTDEDAEPLTPAEERVRVLLHPFSEERLPGRRRAHALGRTARRAGSGPVRRALVAFGTAGAALGGGLGSLLRGRRER